jgi:NDP-sugar pyrophosphorylase family protein
MKGMILAAGYGTRLKPLTDNLPKALVNYKGRPMIEEQIEKLKVSGINSICINAFHHKEKIQEYFEMRQNDGTEITIITENILLGTGGGILNAKKFFKEEEYFFTVNVDVDTDFDYRDIIEYHKKTKNFATLLIQKRETSRYLLFDENLKFTRRAENSDNNKNCYAFNGIHIISSEIFNMEFETEHCDIFDIYTNCVQKGKKIIGYICSGSKFKDIGKIENLI